MSTIKKIVLFGNDFQSPSSALATTLLAWLSNQGIATLVAPQERFDADLVISMGGDGTFLQTAHRVADSQIPILGINTGRLGFLAEVSPKEMLQVLEEVLQGRCRIEERSVLQLSYSEGTPEGYPYALNEIAVLKQDVSSMISISVMVNGEYLTTYQADGVIITTPTGSTGYALSVGGPIMQPGSHVVGILPVAPHSLTVRPVVLTDDTIVTLNVTSRNHRFLVSVDGRSEKCEEYVALTVRKAPYSIRVVKREHASFFDTLRTKLMWGTDLRQV